MHARTGLSTAVTTLDGVVLAARDVGEHDRVYDIFAVGHGLLTVWHASARKRRARALLTLAPFSSYVLTLRPRRAGYTLTEASERAGREGLRGSLVALARAGQLAQVVRSMWPPNEAADRVHDLVCFAFDCLARGEHARASACYPRLLAAAGLMPDPKSCHGCRRQLTAAPAASAQASLLCRACAPEAEPMAQAVWRALCGERVSDEGVADSLEDLVVAWVSNHVGHNVGLRALRRATR